MYIMKKLLILFLAPFLLGGCIEMLWDPDNDIDQETGQSLIPNNEIWYQSVDGFKIPLAADAKFDANIISHKYILGKGVITFDGDVKYLSTQEEHIFAKGERLKKIGLPKSVAIISPTALNKSPNLDEFLGDHASEDGRCLIIDDVIVAFAPYGITEYTTPSEAKSISSGTFLHSKLNLIRLSEGIESIHKYAFQEDINTNPEPGGLEYVYLPSTLKTLEANPFFNNNIKAYYGDSEMVTEDNLALISNNPVTGKKQLLSYAVGSAVEEYTVLEGIQTIAPYAFYNARNLKKLNLPETFDSFNLSMSLQNSSIETITGKCVHEDCRSIIVNDKLVFVAGAGLEYYKTPKCVKLIGKDVFTHMCDLKELVLSDEVEGLEESMWGSVLCQYCPLLESITISSKMTSLGLYPFNTSDEYTPNLKTVYCRPLNPPAIHSASQSVKFENLSIYVPRDTYALYRTSEDWRQYKDCLQPYDYEDVSGSMSYYLSVDYSADGRVGTLQKASEGNGIDIVLLGDAYSDRQIASGMYKEDMEFIYDNLFTKEPYNTFKNLFNVYYVNVVSATEGYEHDGAALKGYFGEGTSAGGDDDAVFEYARNILSDKRIKEAMIIVVMNSDKFAGTCYMYYPSEATDYGSGTSISYFTKGGNSDTFAELLHHEVCGHGFAKLADEYSYEDKGEIPYDYKADAMKKQEEWGWWKNVDFTSDLSQVRWSHLMNDMRYSDDGLGVYEGAMSYWRGVYKATKDSIMRYNFGKFNAPAREAIYYRIHKLSYGKNWVYDYEGFAEYDAINRRRVGITDAKTYNYVEKTPLQLPPPVVIPHKWNEAL